MRLGSCFPVCRTSLLLKMLFVLSLLFYLPPMSAESAKVLSKEQALERIKEFPFYRSEAVLESANRTEMFGVPIWDFTLFGKGYYSIRIRATDGKLLSMSSNDVSGAPNDGHAPVGEWIKRDRAEQIASSFIDGLRWGLDAEWRLDPYPEPEIDTRNEDSAIKDREIFKVRFVRFLHGIRFDASVFTVYVNRDGSVAKYFTSWQDADFEDPSGLIPQTKSETLFRDTSSAVVYYLHGSDGKPHLVYNLWQFYMDAKNGTFPPERNGNPHPNSGRLKPVSYKPLAPLVTNAKLTDAQMLAKAKKILGLTGTYKLKKPSRGQFQFEIPTGVKNRPRTVSVGFHLNTGQVDVLATNDESDLRPVSKPKISEKQARKTAEDFLKLAMPAYADKLTEQGMELVLSAPNPSYWFHYNRIAGGFAVDQESLTIEVSAVNGRVRSLQSYLTPFKYPAIAVPKVDAEQAKKKLLSLYNVEPRYEWTEANRIGLYYKLVLKPAVPRFYIGLAPVLDAESGKWLNIAGEPVVVEDR